MQNTAQNQQYANNHISIDTIVFGFDGKELNVLLVPQELEIGEKILQFKKLPGGLIYQDEDFDAAAQRILSELSGLNNLRLFQYRTYGSKDRTSEKDVLWLQQTSGVKVERIVTTVYISLVKLEGQLMHRSKKCSCTWVPLDKLGDLAFDHNSLVEDALAYFRKIVQETPIILFELLPRKFTILQLRTLYELIYKKVLDIRNFQKKLQLMPYVVPTDEHEEGVRHRAALYYHFDKVIYNKGRR